MSPRRRRFVKSYLAWTFYGYASVVHAAPPAKTNIQLGDSVMMPARAVNMAHEGPVAFFLQEKDLLPIERSEAWSGVDGDRTGRETIMSIRDELNRTTCR